jgi:hypothetical protein
VKEISHNGAHLYTAETWYPGTILTITFQCGSGKNGAKSADFLSVPCKVTGHEQNGMRVVFICAGSEERKALQRFIERLPCRETPLPPRKERGRSLVEFGLTVQFLILLIIIAVNCGGFIYGLTNHGMASHKTGVQDSRDRGHAHSAGASLHPHGKTHRSGQPEK